MTPDKMRELALSLPETSVSEHADRLDFEVDGKVFASQFPSQGWGVLKLDPETQASLTARAPATFEACKGAWGRAGATVVLLHAADEGEFFEGLSAAWRRHASDGLDDPPNEKRAQSDPFD